MVSTNISERVRDFYDRHPYPPPVESLDNYRSHWQDEQRRRADFHLFWPGRSYRENQTILVAGCGTSQAAKHALRWPRARVVGIDCSATSVRHTDRLKKRYDLGNLEVQQLPLERVDELGMDFDQVVCTGVLHHLEDPESGLCALRNVLKPHGAMQIMVYAPYGRTGIYMLQEFCRRVGIHADDDGIRRLVGILGSLPAGHPLHNILVEAPELRNEATLADALLHPQDRAYSVPQFFKFIEDGGLVFGRWFRQAPYSPHCGVISQVRQLDEIKGLPLREQYAALELFRGTMTRHSAILYRDDIDISQHIVNFDAEAWLGYIPVRVSDTICIQNRVPRSAAAVLINRTHTYKDLFLTMNHGEKRLFDLIDGQQTIGAIVDKTRSYRDPVMHNHLARTLFKQLWWHDQVVFDTRVEARHTRNSVLQAVSHV